jgi:histidinol dehydrogenase
VKEIEAGVKTRGDEYSKILTKNYDKALIENMLVSQEEILDAIKKVDKNLKISIKTAYKNIYKFHKRTIPKNLKPKQTSK